MRPDVWDLVCAGRAEAGLSDEEIAERDRADETQFYISELDPKDPERDDENECDWRASFGARSWEPR